jgi:FemAB-related protein (PEP-CTERM system-associated)
MSRSSATSIEIRVLQGADIGPGLSDHEEFVRELGISSLSYHPSWSLVFKRAFHHAPFVIEAREGDRLRGVLSLAFMRSALFGRFLVSLPYLNYGGVLSDDHEVSRLLVERAIELADRLDVRYLELRQERAIDHERFTARSGMKVYMRRALPRTGDELWKQVGTKVRNQVRKGEKAGLQSVWGGAELIPDFYSVFSHNMRDLGTPVYAAKLFHSIAREFGDRVEFCVVRLGNKPLAAAMLVHGWGMTEVPSASSLREYNSTCANMLMYWNLLLRSIDRGQSTFDFGRSSPDSPTFKFKQQWGAEPVPAHWQYYLRTGEVSAMRPDNPRYGMMIRAWQRLPVPLTRWLGPIVVRGIP